MTYKRKELLFTGKNQVKVMQIISIRGEYWVVPTESGGKKRKAVAPTYHSRSNHQKTIHLERKNKVHLYYIKMYFQNQ